MPSPRTALGSVLAALLLATGCGGGDSGGDGKLGAAEPATAPEATAAPDGQVTKVGALPQGIVYDAKTSSLAVVVREPYRLLVLDPDTLEVRRSVPLAGKARHLQLAAPGGPVLVGVETANELVEVPLPDGPTRTTKVERHPHDAAGDAEGNLVVGNEFSGSVSLVRDGKLVTTNDDLQQPGGVVIDGSTVAVVDVGEFTVTTYQLDGLKRIARLRAGAGPTHGVLAGNHRLVVTDTRGNHLLLYGLDPLEKLGTLDLPGSPYGITSDPSTQTVWVTLTARNKLVGFDYSGDRPKQIAEYDTVRQPDTVAVAPGSRTLWVTGTEAGVIQRINR